MSDLLAEIELFMVTTGVPPTVVGLRAVNDGKLVPELRAGRETRRSTERRVRSWMRSRGATAGGSLATSQGDGPAV